jgi:hypothetical protein
VWSQQVLMIDHSLTFVYYLGIIRGGSDSLF